MCECGTWGYGLVVNMVVSGLMFGFDDLIDFFNFNGSVILWTLVLT